MKKFKKYVINIIQPMVWIFLKCKGDMDCNKMKIDPVGSIIIFSTKLYSPWGYINP